MTKWARLLLCAVLAGVTTMWAVAQDEGNSNPKSEVRTLTGCLTKSGSNEYLLTATDGSTWEMHENNAVNLAGHVNQTVEVKGVVSHEKMHNMKEDSKEMAKDAGATKHDTEHGHLKVTDLHKLGETCQ